MFFQIDRSHFLVQVNRGLDNVFENILEVFEAIQNGHILLEENE